MPPRGRDCGSELREPTTLREWRIDYRRPDTPDSCQPNVGESATAATGFTPVSFRCRARFNVIFSDGTPIAEGYGKGFIGPNPPQAPNILPAISAVILADGAKWTFTYDAFGEITNATLPTGGSISYT